MLEWIYQKLSQEENWKTLSDHKISKFLSIFWCGYFEKLNVFPSKNYLVFLTIERYDKELTNIKIWDKNIMPQGGEWGPERGSFLLSFQNLADFGAKCWLIKNFSSWKFYDLW